MFYHITNNKVCMLIFFHVFLNDLSCPWFAKTCTSTYSKQMLSFKYNDRIYTTVDAKSKTFWSTVCNFFFFDKIPCIQLRLQIHLPSFVFNMHVVPNKSSPYTT